MKKLEDQRGGMLPLDKPRFPKLRTTLRLKRVAQELSKILGQEIESGQTEITIKEINGKIFRANAEASRIIDVKMKYGANNGIEKTRKEIIAPWKRRIEEKMKKLRADLNRMTQWEQGNKSGSLTNHCQKIKRNM